MRRTRRRTVGGAEKVTRRRFIKCVGAGSAALVAPAVERARKDSGDNYVDLAGAHVLETLGKNNSASSRVQE